MTMQSMRDRGIVPAMTIGIGIAFGFAAAMGTSAAWNSGTSQDATTTAPAPAGDELVARFQSVVGGLNEAKRHHDGKMVATMRAEARLLERADVITAVSDRATALAANVLAADARHDYRSAAYFRSQISALCATPPSLVFEFCDWDLP